jgi:hypothetical protein
MQTDKRSIRKINKNVAENDIYQILQRLFERPEKPNSYFITFLTPFTI